MIKMKSALIEMLLIIIAIIPLINCQIIISNTDLKAYPILNVPDLNTTIDQPFMTSTICLYFPDSAATALADDDWKDTLSQLFLTKGWPKTSIYYQNYNNIQDFSVNPQFYCDYNIVIVIFDSSNTLDTSELANQILFNWECNPMDVTLYYYSQTSPENKWLATGTDCTVSVCPLNMQTLGIGCSTTNTSTFESVATNEKFVIIDVVDDVNHKINLNQATCTIRNCIKKDERMNVALLQVGGYNVADLSDDPVSVPDDPRIMRIQWKKWWQVFYTIVDYINDIVTVMFARSRSLDVSQFYYRR